MRKSLLTLLLAALAFPAFACDETGEMRRAMSQAQASARAARLDAANRAIAEAKLLKKIMESCLIVYEIPGPIDLSREAVAVDAADDAAYAAVAARLSFLRGAPGSKVVLPVKLRSAQFAALKSDYAATLARASVHLKAAGERPGAMKWLWGLAEWGRESWVNDGGQEAPVLTTAQRDAILAPSEVASPAPERDPRE